MSVNFSTEVVETNGETVIIVRGEIDMATAGRLRDVIEPHMAPKQRIVLELSGIDFMDSACLHVLEQARGRLTADGGSLVLRNPSKAAHRLLTLTEARDLLETDAGKHPEEHRD